MARTRGKRRRRILLLVVLGGAVWYVRSRRPAVPAADVTADLPSAPPAPRAEPVERAAEPVEQAGPVPAEPPAAEPAAPAVEPTRVSSPDADDGEPTVPPVAQQALFTPPATVEPPSNGATDPQPAGTEPAPGTGGTPSRPDGSAPGPDFTIKGNAGSMLFHLPTSPYYKRTKAEVWFRTADEARAAGFTEWTPRKRASR